MKAIYFFVCAAMMTMLNLTAAELHNIVIVRHGESDHNAAKIYNSNPNHPTYKVSYLTENGKAITKETAKELLEKGINDQNVVAVYVSPMPRTQETAQILSDAGLFNSDKITLDERLTEVDAGDLEGGPIIEKWEDYMSELHHCEPIAHINARVDDFYYEIKTRHQCKGNVVVVTHGIITQKLKSYLTDNDKKILPGHAEVFPIQ